MDKPQYYDKTYCLVNLCTKMALREHYASVKEAVAAAVSYTKIWKETPLVVLHIEEDTYKALIVSGRVWKTSRVETKEGAAP